MTRLRSHRVGIQPRQRPYSPPLELGFPGAGKTWDQGCELDLAGTGEPRQCSEQGTSMFPGLAVCAQLQTNSPTEAECGTPLTGSCGFDKTRQRNASSKERSEDEVASPVSGTSSSGRSLGTGKGACSCFLCPPLPTQGALLQTGAQFPCLGSQSSQPAGATWLSTCLCAHARVHVRMWCVCIKMQGEGASACAFCRGTCAPPPPATAAAENRMPRL